MFIKTEKNRRTKDTMFIFNFTSQQEFDTFMQKLEEIYNTSCSCENDDDGFHNIIDTARYRCDDKYAKDDVACSFLLFSTEMARFTNCIICRC